jgi:ubiquinone/menaquinone biosynthesis C-methylase UbiE
MNNYAPISPDSVADESAELVTCYIGLHHIDPPVLDGFMRSIVRVMKPDGMFILRDHDVVTPEMDTFVSLAQTVFNAGLGAPWEVNRAELRHFVSIAEWTRRLQAVGLKDAGQRLAQAHDPSDNLLMAFVK